MRSVTSRRLLLLALVITFVGGFRSLTVGHLSDDWAILSHVSRHGNGDAWTGPWLGMPSLRFHRPVFTGLYDLEYRVFGTNPLPAHIHHLLWHLASTFLVFELLRRFGVDPRGAAFGSIVFGIHPLLPAATGWLAGRCGTVAGTLTLLTLCAWQRRSMCAPHHRRRWHLLALVAAMLAALTRESGYLALIAPLTLDLTLVGPRPRLRELVRLHAPFALAGLFLLALRLKALGTLGGGYPEPDGLAAGLDRFPQMMELLGDAFVLLLSGISPGLLGKNWMVPASLGLGTVVIFLLGLRATARHSLPLARAARALTVLFAFQLLLLLVSGPTLHPSTGQRWYGAIALFCALLGLSAAPLLNRSKLFAPLFLLPILATGHVLVQNDLLLGDRITKSVLAQTKSLIAENHRLRRNVDPPVPLGPVFVSCLPESQHGIPTMQWAFSEALRPPFAPEEPPSPIYAVHRFMYLGKQTEWMFHPPIEPSLHVQGKFPLAIGMLEPFLEQDDRLGVADVGGLIDARGDRPPLWPAFGGQFLEVLEPPRVFHDDAPMGGTPFRIPIKVTTLGCKKLEFFFFLPTADMRYPVSTDGPIFEADFGFLLEDFVRFRGTETMLYVLVVGHRPDNPATPYLSHAIRFRWKPD